MDKAQVYKMVNAWFHDSEENQGHWHSAPSFCDMLNIEYPEFRFTYSVQTNEILVD